MVFLKVGAVCVAGVQVTLLSILSINQSSFQMSVSGSDVRAAYPARQGTGSICWRKSPPLNPCPSGFLPCHSVADNGEQDKSCPPLSFTSFYGKTGSAGFFQPVGLYGGSAPKPPASSKEQDWCHRSCWCFLCGG